MNLKWKQNFIKRNNADEFYAVYDSVYSNAIIRCVVYIGYKNSNLNGKRMVHGAFYFKNLKSISDGLFYDVSADLFEICKNIVGNEIFTTTMNEYFITSKFPIKKPFTFGNNTQTTI